MNRTDSLGADPLLLARLQATLPDPNGARKRGTDSQSHLGHLSVEDLANHPSGHKPSPRLQQTTFSSRSTRHREPAVPPARVQIKKHTNWLGAAFEALWSQAWLILSLAILAGSIGYLYTVRLCVPLYKVQASIEVRNSKSSSHTEALAHVLVSQSLVNSVLASMPPNQRSELVEHSGWLFGDRGGLVEALHQRLDAVAIPSAQVIDISIVSPSRPAAIRFINGLIEALASRESSQREATTAMPDDWSMQSDEPRVQISIIDAAVPSVDPVAPSLFRNLLAFVFSGALLGVVIALSRKFATNTFGGPGSVSEILGVRELGAIPERKLLGPAGLEPMQAQAGIQMDANDESLRYLRSSLLYQPGKQQIRFLAFTSAAPGEGKTTVVANLSMSLAATGRRVLVIDGDLRRPRLHKLMQVAAGPGLADLLRRDPSAPPALLSRFVIPTAFQNLYILPPGTPGQDAPELLAGPHLHQLFRELAKSFDFVLIDTPPLLACSDARNYARAVEGVVLVVRSSETQKRAALVARDMLLQDGATILGTVLTGWRQNYPSYNYPPTAAYSKT